MRWTNFSKIQAHEIPCKMVDIDKDYQFKSIKWSGIGKERTGGLRGRTTNAQISTLSLARTLKCIIQDRDTKILENFRLISKVVFVGFVEGPIGLVKSETLQTRGRITWVLYGRGFALHFDNRFRP
jgi:hypothetical protein